MAILKQGKKKKSAKTEQLYFNINEVAKVLDVVPSTIRNWEKAGLFKAKRAGNNYRIFDFNDIEFLKRIKGYSMDENMNMTLIKRLLTQNVVSFHPERVIYSKRIYNAKFREFRERRNLTLEEVSGETGISKAHLSRMEQGVGQISLSLMEKLAQFYGESILGFFNIEEEENHSVMVQADTGNILETALDGVEVRCLNTTTVPFAPTKFTVAPGAGDLISHKHESGTEFIYVLSGKLYCVLDEKEVYILKEGDSIFFSSTRMHSWNNPGNSQLEMIWIHSAL